MYLHDEQEKGMIIKTLGIFATFQHNQVRIEVITSVIEVHKDIFSLF